MLRRFTETDWNGFAGAEPFEDGSDPFIAEVDLVISKTREQVEGIVIGDANGVSVIFDGEGDLFTLYDLSNQGWRGLPDTVETFLRGLLLQAEPHLYTHSLERMGFVRS